MFLPVVALLAGRGHIAADAPAAADYGDQVVHGEFFGGKLIAAIAADSLGYPVPPPLGLAQFPCLILLPPDLLFGNLDDEIVHKKSVTSDQ